MNLTVYNFMNLIWHTFSSIKAQNYKFCRYLEENMIVYALLLPRKFKKNGKIRILNRKCINYRKLCIYKV